MIALWVIAGCLALPLIGSVLQCLFMTGAVDAQHKANYIEAMKKRLEKSKR